MYYIYYTVYTVTTEQTWSTNEEHEIQLKAEGELQEVDIKWRLQGKEWTCNMSL